MEWISVDDRLPTTEEDSPNFCGVFVYVELGRGRRLFGIAEYQSEYTGQTGVVFAERWDIYVSGDTMTLPAKVTHWMPLLAPGEDEGV